MREIKFRAWDNVLDKMVSWDTICETCGIDNLLGDKNYELMQFTGLYDKKGKEIYEGDIIENIKYGGTMLIRWGIPNETYAGWCVEWIRSGLQQNRPTYDLLYYTEHMENCEIIGNKHENKEYQIKEIKS